ncbi:PAS domain S-box protein [Geminisphaera colitermitum]|uniref:PAS domain S-box protein n=1 Tax=Geminisphaera colitermitum TaxID=1148786 RepID=UPI000158E0F3|nr:PAS domain S-box protein [Geminisphaera colitermitum]
MPHHPLSPTAPPLPGVQGDWWQWLRHAIDEHAIMAVTDTAGTIRYANKRFCEISGYSWEELIGQNHRILKSGVHPASFYAHLWQTITTGRIWRGAICNRAKDGHPYWVQSTILPLPGPDGKPAGYLALRTDVSRLVKAEQELATRTQELRLLFDHSPMGLSWRSINPDGTPGANHVNQRFCQIIGLNEKQALDIENVHRATHPDDWARQEELTREIYSGKRDQFTLEKRYIHSDGAIVWTILTVVVLRDTEGRVTHHFAMLEDITARRRTEDELKRTEARWRTYLETASEILYALTPEGRVKFISQAITAKLGYTVEEVTGHRFAEIIHPKDRPRCQTFIAETIRDGTSHAPIEYRVRHKDGRWIWHATTGSAYNDRDGRRAYFGVARDISLRRQAQDELRAALARLEEMARIINRSPSVVVLWKAEPGWPVEFVSQSIHQFGYAAEDFAARKLTFRDITYIEDRERVNAEVEAHAVHGDREYTQEYRVQCRDGSLRWVDDHTIVRVDAHGRVTHHEGVITDITARKAAEDRERETRERELTLARDVQQHLLPNVFPEFAHVEVNALSQPSRHLGGDYYDVIPVDPAHCGVVIADVSGKGAPAALMMAACRALLRQCAQGQLSPAAVLHQVNRALQPDMPPRMFITLFYGIIDLDTLELRYARAGHEPAILMRAGHEQPELLDEGGLALGMAPAELFDATLVEGRVVLGPGDLVALYTDGVNEACNVSGEEFGRERLVEAFARCSGLPLGEILKRVDRHLRQFCTLAPRDDDRALLLVRAKNTGGRVS